MNREAFLTAWLTLAFTNKVGSKTFEKLLKQFKTPAAVLENIAEVKRRFKLELEPPSKAEIEDLIAKCYNFQGEIILPIDDIYPALLREIEGYPQVLFAKGKIELLNSQKIAIVGTRNSSANGERITRKIAYELGKNGIVVVSGLARGIDAAAHEASLEGGTIAVVAGGIDVIYPRENDKLQKMLYEKGLVISENVIGTVATSSNFPRRNRIISGMSKGVLIVEAMEKSGTMITANYALEQGRDVFAVPGSPLDQRAFGTNLLIKNGAILTRDASDILSELGYETAARQEESKGFEEPSSINEKILIKLSNVPTDIDDLFNIVNISTSEFNRALTELEILGKITRQGNKISLI